jgi:hypothetical protein
MSGERDLFGYPHYDGNPPSQRHSDTSRAAADSIRKRVGPLHVEIIEFLAGCAGEPMRKCKAGFPCLQTRNVRGVWS